MLLSSDLIFAAVEFTFAESFRREGISAEEEEKTIADLYKSSIVSSLVSAVPTLGAGDSPARLSGKEL